MSEKNETDRMINDLMYAVEKKMKVSSSQHLNDAFDHLKDAQLALDQFEEEHELANWKSIVKHDGLNGSINKSIDVMRKIIQKGLSRELNEFILHKNLAGTHQMRSLGSYR